MKLTQNRTKTNPDAENNLDVEKISNIEKFILYKICHHWIKKSSNYDHYKYGEKSFRSRCNGVKSCEET